MKKTSIFIHVGMQKTGTTALQLWLSQNKETLLNKYGILYPDAGLIRNAHYIISDILGFAYPEKPISTKDLNKFKRLFLEEINLKKPNKVLLSSEYFVNDKDITIIKNFFHEFDCKIIIYLRRHDAWFDSIYRHSLVVGNKPIFPWGVYRFYEFFKSIKNYTSYEQFIDKWASTFGINKIILRLYNENENIIYNFAKIFNLEITSDAEIYRSINNSLSRESCFYLHQIKLQNLSKDEHHRIIKYVKNDNTNFMSFISPDQKKTIIRDFAHQYSSISKRYLNVHNDFLFNSLEVEKDNQWYPFIEPHPEEIEKKIQKMLKFLRG